MCGPRYLPVLSVLPSRVFLLLLPWCVVVQVGPKYGVRYTCLSWFCAKPWRGKSMDPKKDLSRISQFRTETVTTFSVSEAMQNLVGKLCCCVHYVGGAVVVVGAIGP